jgi:hypothetical protein
MHWGGWQLQPLCRYTYRNFYFGSGAGQCGEEVGSRLEHFFFVLRSTALLLGVNF